MKKNNILRTSALIMLFFISACNGSKQEQAQKIHEKIDTKKKEIADLEMQLKELNGGQKENIDVSKFISTIPATRRDFVMYLEAPAKVYTKQNIYVTGEIGGALKAVYATAGMQARKGMPLAQVDDELIQKNIAEVEGYYQLANDVYTRQKNLWDQKIGSEIQYLQAKNNKESLEKKLSTIRAQLSKTTIVSPIDGVVDEVYGKFGQLTGPTTPICRIVNLSQIYIEAEVAESYVGKFKKGETIIAEYAPLNYHYEVPIAAITQQIDPANHTFKVTANIPNPDGQLKPNLLINTKLVEYNSKNKVVVPTKLVQEGMSGNYIMTVNANGVVEKKQIKVGRSYNGSTEVQEGLNGDEQLIDLGYKNVVEGDKVTVKNQM
ncbi:MAG: transporter [Bacteroidota bacterium]|nr:transporter [Bacteroidota bacterium]